MYPPVKTTFVKYKLVVSTKAFDQNVWFGNLCPNSPMNIPGGAWSMGFSCSLQGSACFNDGLGSCHTSLSTTLVSHTVLTNRIGFTDEASEPHPPKCQTQSPMRTHKPVEDQRRVFTEIKMPRCWSTRGGTVYCDADLPAYWPKFSRTCIAASPNA